MNIVEESVFFDIEKLRNRKAFLFDISVWNRLADGKDKESIEVCETLISLKNRGVLFCPLSTPAIWELRKQGGISFMRTAKLMEELSLNVTFREIDQLFNYEIDHFIKYLLTDEFIPLSIDKLFGPLLSYLSPSFFLINSAGQLTEEQKKFNDSLSERIQNISLTSLMEILGEKSCPGSKKTPKFQAANIKRNEFVKSEKTKMKRLEQEHIANSIILPRFNEMVSILPLEQQFFIINKLDKLPKSKKYGSVLEYMLSFMPALLSYVQIETVSGYDINRKDTDNDFFDKEILIYGLSYASIFVAFDRWLKDLIGLIRKDGNIGSLCYVGNLHDLKEQLTISHIHPSFK